MRRTKFFNVIIWIVLLAITVFAEKKELDGIAAVVGDSVILKSEVNAYVDMKIAATGGKSDALVRGMLYREALGELIDGKVLVVHAIKDTNIEYSESEVSTQVDKRIASIMEQNHLDEEMLEAALQKEQGMSIEDFRNQMMIQSRQELITQRVNQFYFGGRDLSHDEVQIFYDKYRDSLPPAGESIKLQKLEISLDADSTVRQNAYDTIVYIRDMITNGEATFPDLAKKFSKGPNAESGGDLGFVSKGTLTLIQLEERIFLLEPGEISDPIETELGFHLVKVLDRRENKVHALHIYIPVMPSEKAVVETKALVNSVYESNFSKDEFSKFIKNNSTDAVSKAYGGILDWQLVSSLSPLLKKNLLPPYEKGKYSKAFNSANNYYIYRVEDYDKSRKMSMEEDFDQIKRFAQQINSKDKLKELIKSWHKDTFIKVYK